ncbi:MAG TPA: glycosyltransferase family 4 protein [Acidimicrobiales bacterium]|nr:glycosyltransferase family 4 protein [Acidimicrobiales bacterium]
MIETTDSRDAAGSGSSTSTAPLRVLLVDVSDRGGIARYCASLRAALRREGASVSLAAPDGLADAGLSLARRHWGPDVSGLARARLLGRRLVEIGPSTLFLGRAVVRARCDVVHVHTEVVPLFDHLVLGAIARRVPVVITAHDPEPLHGGARALEREARRWRAADAVIIHGEGQRPLVESSAPGVAVHVVPVDLDLGGPPVPRAEARRRLGLDEAPTALLLGLIRPYKGIDLLADVWPQVTARVPGARLVVAGEPYACPDLDRLERQEGVEIRRGFIDEDEFDCYAAAPDVLVLPYHRGSHSGILHRGAAAGTPVLASPSLADEVRRTGAGLVVPMDRTAWSDALVTALSGHPPPPPPAVTGRATAVGTLAVYRDVLDRRTRSSRRRRPS